MSWRGRPLADGIPNETLTLCAFGYEEIYPFSLFAVRRYGEQDDVVCVPNRDEGRDFDADVRAASRAVKVEITLARDPLWHLRREPCPRRRGGR